MKTLKEWYEDKGFVCPQYEVLKNRDGYPSLWIIRCKNEQEKIHAHIEVVHFAKQDPFINCLLLWPSSETSGNCCHFYGDCGVVVQLKKLRCRHSVLEQGRSWISEAVKENESDFLTRLCGWLNINYKN